MRPALYDEWVDWYRLVDPPADHLEEAEAFRAAFANAISGPAQTLLELGSGAGHNAVHLKRWFRCTLTDLSEPMLGLSRELNPECEHQTGDMRTLRLGRTFDAVLVHDAVMYMTTEQDLAAAIRTAFEHTRPGGAAIFAPDCVRETFVEQSQLLSEESGDRSMRGIEWVWDPDPTDTTYAADYSLMFRQGAELRAVLDRHVEGLFPRAMWIGLFEQTGYQVDQMSRPLGDGAFDRVFLCRRP